MNAEDVQALFIERAEAVALKPVFAIRIKWRLFLPQGPCEMFLNTDTRLAAPAPDGSYRADFPFPGGINFFRPFAVIDANDMLSGIEAHGCHASTVQGVQK